MISMLKYNTSLYFGKGRAINNASKMIKIVKKNRIKEKVEVRIRMFKKKLRGAINCINLIS